MNILMAVIWYMLIGVAAMFITGLIFGIAGVKKYGAVAANNMGQRIQEENDSRFAKKSTMFIIKKVMISWLLWPFSLATTINNILNTYFTKDEKTE